MFGLPPSGARRRVSAARLAGARRAEGWRWTTGRERAE
jgi:hypothetical protein